jgi:transcriptional regulator with XRE-family HTH domain
MPGIIGFLGYNPLPKAKSMAEQLVRHRGTLGLSQKEAARAIRVDPCTLARWERGEREPTGTLLSRVVRFLTGGETRREAVSRVG